MREKAVDIDNVGKVYRVYATPLDRAWELVSGRPRHREFQALAGVSFALQAGEALGIVGENGAGKSTLLKILAGIVAPSSGRVTVRGKVASILELGSGFHPDLTGRQNIVLNAALLGLSEREVRERTPAIVDFSELGEFIDQPVKCYSTGMVVRLGFAIATQVDPDVLIIDEALSVGDGYFQKRCMDRLLELIAAGKTLLFCSHAMYYVSAFCGRALWLRHGRAEALGPTAEVVREYETFLLAKGAAREAVAPAPAAPAAAARLTGWRCQGADGPATLRLGDPLVCEIEWESTDPGLEFQIGVGVNRVDGIEVCSFSSQLDGLPPATGARHYRLRLEIPELPLVKGEFMVYLFLLDREALHVYDQRLIRPAFRLEGPVYRFGLVDVPHRWLPVGEDGVVGTSSRQRLAAR
jgi:homopolymeric O-antigen transport system ATP-binding protein